MLVVFKYLNIFHIREEIIIYMLLRRKKTGKSERGRFWPTLRNFDGYIQVSPLFDTKNDEAEAIEILLGCGSLPKRLNKMMPKSI